ncbi:hypothetical protein ACFQ0T_13925 [Kitasatospora gansuensis]
MGLTRRYRHMNWTATPDLEPDAPPTLHIFQCNGENEQGVLCGQQSAAARTSRPPAAGRSSTSRRTRTTAATAMSCPGRGG